MQFWLRLSSVESYWQKCYDDGDDDDGGGGGVTVTAGQGGAG